MEEAERAIGEALRCARKADDQAERMLLATPQDERDGAWAEQLAEMVREARVALRAALSVVTPAAAVAEADQQRCVCGFTGGVPFKLALPSSIGKPYLATSDESCRDHRTCPRR